MTPGKRPEWVKPTPDATDSLFSLAFPALFGAKTGTRIGVVPHRTEGTKGYFVCTLRSAAVACRRSVATVSAYLGFAISKIVVCSYKD